MTVEPIEVSKRLWAKEEGRLSEPPLRLRVLSVSAAQAASSRTTIVVDARGPAVPPLGDFRGFGRRTQNGAAARPRLESSREKESRSCFVGPRRIGPSGTLLPRRPRRIGARSRLQMEYRREGAVDLSPFYG
jgi:hypothetical protein